MPNTPTPDRAAIIKQAIDARAGAGKQETTAGDAAAASGEIPRSEYEALQKKHKNLERIYGQLSQEVGVYRKRFGGYDEGEGYETEPEARQPRNEQANLDTLQRLDFVDFRMDNPDWKEHWDSVLKVIEDPMLQRSVIAFRKDTPGIPDYYVTYHNALREVKLRAYEEAKAKQAAAQAKAQEEAEAKKAELRRQAVGSGSEATSQESQVNLGDGGSAADLLKQFPELVDRNDPPSMFRRHR